MCEEEDLYNNTDDKEARWSNGTKEGECFLEFSGDKEKISYIYSEA